MRTALSLALLVSLAGCSQVSSFANDVRASRPADDGPLPDVPRTVWDTTYGDMRLSRLTDGRVTAYYEGEDGTLDGTLAGRTYAGIWVEPSSSVACPTTRRGSDHWGRFEFTFNAALDRFEGAWSYCDKAPAGRRWTGTKR